MKLPRRPPSLAALAIVPVIALLTARGGERAARSDDALDRGASLLAYRGAQASAIGEGARTPWRALESSHRPSAEAPTPRVPF